MTHHYNLGFISDEDIYTHVKATVGAYRREITLDQFNENIIDPIKLTFDSKVYGKTIRQAIEDECFRQIDKSNTNKIGYFHQNIFKYAGNGWVVPKAGFDVENEELHIYVKISSKIITLNSALKRKTFIAMQDKLLEDKQNICIVADEIFNNSFDIPWKVTFNGETFQHERIRHMSLDNIYSLVFNDTTAYEKLRATLPIIVDDININ